MSRTNTQGHIHVVMDSAGIHHVLEFERQGHNSHLDKHEEDQIMIGNQMIDDLLLANNEDGALVTNEDVYGYTDELT